MSRGERHLPFNLSTQVAETGESLSFRRARVIYLKRKRKLMLAEEMAQCLISCHADMRTHFWIHRAHLKSDKVVHISSHSVPGVRCEAGAGESQKHVRLLIFSWAYVMANNRDPVLRWKVRVDICAMAHVPSHVGTFKKWQMWPTVSVYLVIWKNGVQASKLSEVLSVL